MKTYILLRDVLKTAFVEWQMIECILKEGDEFSLCSDNFYRNKAGWKFFKETVETNPTWFKLKEGSDDSVIVPELDFYGKVVRKIKHLF